MQILKTLALAGAAFTLVSIGPAFGQDRSAVNGWQPGVSGVVGFYGGAGESDSTFTNTSICCGSFSFSDTNDLKVFGGYGRATIPLTGGFNLQIDFFGEDKSTKFDFGGSNSVSSLAGGAHLFWRNPNVGLLGVFASYGHVNVFETVYERRFGLEGQVFWGPVTLYGQGGYIGHENDGSTFNDTETDTGFMRGQIRYFLTDNAMLYGELAYYDSDTTFTACCPSAASGSGEVVTYGAGGVYRFDNSPLAIYGSVMASNADQTRINNFNTTVTEFDEVVGKFGIKLFLGTGSVKSNDRSGTSLDLVPFFPDQNMRFLN